MIHFQNQRSTARTLCGLKTTGKSLGGADSADCPACLERLAAAGVVRLTGFGETVEYQGRVRAAKRPRTIAVAVEDHGSIMLFRPNDDDAKKWLEDHVQQDAQWFGGALVVEPRYAQDLVNGLEAEGFIL